MARMKDWSNIYEKYKGLWVGLADDEETVIASGKTIKMVVEASKSKGNSDPILFRVPDEIVDFVGYGIYL